MSNIFKTRKEIEEWLQANPIGDSDMPHIKETSFAPDNCRGTFGEWTLEEIDREMDRRVELRQRK